MANIPIVQRGDFQQEEQFAQGGVPQVGYQPRGLDFSSIQQGIGNWQQRRQQRIQRETEEQARYEWQQQAELRQRQLGPGQIAQPDPDAAARFQRAFEEQARAVHQEQLETEMQQVRGRLSREYRNDPQGFMDAWRTSGEEKYQQLKDQDAVLAERVRDAWEREGIGTQQKLAENAFARENAAKVQELKTLFQRRSFDVGRQLRENPDEEVWQGAYQSLADSIDQKVERGILDASTAESHKQQLREQLTTDFVYGKFFQSVETGEFETAQELIEDLRYGGLYEDTGTAHQMANTLEQRLDRRLRDAEGAMQERFERRLKPVEDAKAAVEKDIDMPYSPEIQEDLLEGNIDRFQAEQREIERRIEQAHKYAATQEQVEEWHELATDLQIMHGLKNETSRMSVNQIETAKNNLQQLREEGLLSDTQHDSLHNMLEDREKEINEAIRAGDYAGATQIEINPMNTTVEDYQRRLSQGRAIMGEAYMEHENTIWSHDELDQIEQRLNQAIEAGDRQDLANVITNVLEPISHRPEMMRRAVRQLGDHGGLISAAAAMAEEGNVQDVAEIGFYAMIADRNDLSDSDLRRLTGEEYHIEDYFVEEEWQQAIDSIAKGDSLVAPNVRDTFADIYRGMAQFFYDRGVDDVRGRVEDEMNRVLHQFRPDQTFEVAGTHVPKRIVPTPEFRDSIEDHVNNPQDHFGGDLAAEGLIPELITPVYAEEGVMFREEGTGEYLVQEDGETAYVLEYPEGQTIKEDKEEREARMRTGGPGVTYAEDTDIVESVKNALGWLRQKAGEAHDHIVGIGQQNIRRRAETRFELGEGMLEGLNKASAQTAEDNPEHTLISNAYAADSYMIRHDAHDEVRWDRVRAEFARVPEEEIAEAEATELWGDIQEKDSDELIRDRNMAPYIAADLLDQYRQQFDTETEVWAAYTMGPDTVNELKEEYGDDWYRFGLPVDVKGFIRRVRNAN